MEDGLASHAPTAASGAIEPGVDHRPSGLGASMRPIEAVSAVPPTGPIGLVPVGVRRRHVLGSPIAAADEIASRVFSRIVTVGAVIPEPRRGDTAV